MEKRKLSISNVVTQDVGVLFKDDKNDYYTLARDTYDFVKYESCIISSKSFIIIDIHHELFNDREKDSFDPYYRKNYGYTDEIIKYLKEHGTWENTNKRKRSKKVDTDLMILKDVKTVTFVHNEYRNNGIMYMHFHNSEIMDIDGNDCDLDESVKNVEVYNFDNEPQKCYVSAVNILGCKLFNDVNIVIKSDDKLNIHSTHTKGYETLTIFNSSVISCDDDPLFFTNTYGLLSGYIDSSTFNNMHIVANNIHINHSVLGYREVNEGVPYSCIFHDRYNNIKSDKEFKLAMYDSKLCLTDDIKFTCNVRLNNVNISTFCSIEKEVSLYHNINFFLPDNTGDWFGYRYRIVKPSSKGGVKNRTTSNIFNTCINLYNNETATIESHVVTVTIEDLRCDMHKWNKHLFYRAYVVYGNGKSHNIYPLDIFLRNSSNDTKAKYNKRQVKEFYKNLDMIAELSGINLSIF